MKEIKLKTAVTDIENLTVQPKSEKTFQRTCPYCGTFNDGSQTFCCESRRIDPKGKTPKPVTKTDK